MIGEAGDTLIPVFLVIWMSATLICLIWGFFIFRRYRRLAWCCFAIAFLQIILAILPLIGTRNVKRHFHSQSLWPNKFAGANRQYAPLVRNSTPETPSTRDDRG